MPFHRISKLIFILIISIGSHNVSSQLVDKTITYDQCIQIISNLSDVNSQRIESKSVRELLDRNVGGFRFHYYGIITTQPYFISCQMAI